LTVSQRGKYLKDIARIIRQNAKELARIESADTGKPIKHATFIDVPTCAATFENFGRAKSFLRSRQNPVPAPVKSLTVPEPLGVVGCIIPWNYPLIMFAWKVAPALLAGNTVVFKPSSQACAAVMKLAQLIREADLPVGVLNVVPSSDHGVASLLVKSPDVDMISFTGGTETGRWIMSEAAKVPKKVGLELGGKSPNIVFADCDIEAALGGTMAAIFMNQGQMCVAGSRLLLEEKIYDEFLQKLVARTKALRLGDPKDPKTEFGPLINTAHRDRVLQYIDKGKVEGAKLLCGGKIPEDKDLVNGAYLEPAIFAEVTPNMTIAREEIFGPVLSVIKFSTTEEALRIANDSRYGLAACVWTKDRAKAGLIARMLKCGTVWVNTYGGFYDQAPYGGYKQSGIGRELGLEGVLEYTQTKHVCADATPGGKALVTRWFSPMNPATVFVFVITLIISRLKKSFLRF